MNIQKTGQEINRKLNVLIHGQPGSGKTRFAGTSINKFKPLILSAESGLLSLNALGTFDYVEIRKYEDLQKVAQELFNGKSPYDTVILDSLTEIQKVCMTSILSKTGKDQAQIQDWGTLNTMMTAMIRGFRDSRFNLIVTALTTSIEDQLEQTERFAPMLQGALKDTIAGFFDEVFFMANKTEKNSKGEMVVKRFLVTQNTGKVLAKDRSGKLDLMEEPDFCRVYEKIFGVKSAPQAENL